MIANACKHFAAITELSMNVHIACLTNIQAALKQLQLVAIAEHGHIICLLNLALKQLIHSNSRAYDLNFVMYVSRSCRSAMTANPWPCRPAYMLGVELHASLAQHTCIGNRSQKLPTILVP